MQHYLISYDISVDKKRNKAFRMLKKRADPVQKSVFIYAGSVSELTDLEYELRSLLDDTDSLFILPCCKSCFAAARVHCGNIKNQAMIA